MDILTKEINVYLHKNINKTKIETDPSTLNIYSPYDSKLEIAYELSEEDKETLVQLLKNAENIIPVEGIHNYNFKKNKYYYLLKSKLVVPFNVTEYGNTINYRVRPEIYKILNN